MRPTRKFRNLVLLQSATLLALGASSARAGNLGVNLNINLGEPPRQVIVTPPPPAYAPPPQPVYAAPAPPPAYQPGFVVDSDVDFVYPSALGCYVAVGVPYDLFYLNNYYFVYRDGRWLRSPGGRGPWMAVRYRELPPGLRRYRLERMREFRNREYAVYSRDRDHYPGRHFRREREFWHHEAKEQRREDRMAEKERRREDHFREKEERRENRRREWDDRH